MVRHYEMLGEANDYLRKHLSEAEKKKLSHVQAESLVGKILISSLNELWEEKGVLTHEEWEEYIKKRIEKNLQLKRYRDIQFKNRKEEERK
jgi:hypothetical protein